MAVLIALIGGISAPDILKDVINSGVLKLHSAYATTMIGAILAAAGSPQSRPHAVYTPRSTRLTPLVLPRAIATIVLKFFECVLNPDFSTASAAC